MHQGDGLDDNGYDEKGNKVNDKGGDDTDYLYRDGKIIGSKKYLVSLMNLVKYLLILELTV